MVVRLHFGYDSVDTSIKLGGSDISNSIVELSQRNAARLAGIGYLVIIATGIFAEFIIRSGLIVPGDATATASNISTSATWFRIGIASDLVMLTFDAIVALALFALLKSVNQNLVLTATIFRLLHTAVTGVKLLNLVKGARLVQPDRRTLEPA